MEASEAATSGAVKQTPQQAEAMTQQAEIATTEATTSGGPDERHNGKGDGFEKKEKPNHLFCVLFLVTCCLERRVAVWQHPTWLEMGVSLHKSKKTTRHLGQNFYQTTPSSLFNRRAYSEFSSFV